MSGTGTLLLHDDRSALSLLRQEAIRARGSAFAPEPVQDVHGNGYPALAKSTPSTVEREGPVLPGHGERGEVCGDRVPMLCRECHRAFWGSRSCLRRECPGCYESWAAREGREAGLRAWVAARVACPSLGRSMGARLVTYTLSYPDDGSSLADLRERARRDSKEHGIVGGLLVWHPWRKGEEDYYHPDGTTHFHGVGVAPGEIVPGTDKGGKDHIFKVIKDKEYGDFKGFRRWRSVARCVRYLLTHAGIVAGRHAVTWWGRLSYNAMPNERLAHALKPDELAGPETGPPCPYCKSRFTGPTVIRDWTDGGTWVKLCEDPPPDAPTARWDLDPTGSTSPPAGGS